MHKALSDLVQMYLIPVYVGQAELKIDLWGPDLNHLYWGGLLSYGMSYSSDLCILLAAGKFLVLFVVSAAVHETVLQMLCALGFFQPLRLQNKISHSFLKKNKRRRQGWEVQQIRQALLYQLDITTQRGISELLRTTDFLLCAGIFISSFNQILQMGRSEIMQNCSQLPHFISSSESERALTLCFALLTLWNRDFCKPDEKQGNKLSSNQCFSSFYYDNKVLLSFICDAYILLSSIMQLDAILFLWARQQWFV